MEVTIDCICPPKDGERRHGQDTIILPDTLDFTRTITVRQAIRVATRRDPEGLSLAELTAVMAEAYLLHSIDAWTLVDGHGEPLPVTKANVREYLLSNPDIAEEVGNACDEAYSEKVVFPLLYRAPTSSPPTPMPEPTSPTTPGSTIRRPRKGSKPSSTFTSPMAVTGPMAASPAGDSNSWQS